MYSDIKYISDIFYRINELKEFRLIEILISLKIFVKGYLIVLYLSLNGEVWTDITYFRLPIMIFNYFILSFVSHQLSILKSCRFKALLFLINIL